MRKASLIAIPLIAASFLLAACSKNYSTGGTTGTTTGKATPAVAPSVTGNPDDVANALTQAAIDENLSIDPAQEADLATQDTTEVTAFTQTYNDNEF